MEEVEIVSIADAGYVAVKGAFAEVGWFEVGDGRNAAQVGFVDADEAKGGGGGEEGESDGLGRGVFVGGGGACG